MSETVNWKAEVSMAQKALVEAGEVEAVSVIRNGKLSVNISPYDNWKDNITYYEITFQLKYNAFF